MTLAQRLVDPIGFIQYTEAQDAWALVRLAWPELPAAMFAMSPGVAPNASVYPDRLAHINFEYAQMPSYDFWHETGHIIEWTALIARFPDSRCWAPAYPQAVWGAPDNTVLRDYWAARVLPGNFWDHFAGTWDYLAWECFADTFMAVNIAHAERTWANGYLPLDQTKLLALFRDFGGETVAKWLSGDTAFTTNTLGNGMVRVQVPIGALVSGRTVQALPQRIGIAGTETTMPTFGANVATDLSYVDVYVRGDPVHGGTGYLRLLLAQ